MTVTVDQALALVQTRFPVGDENWARAAHVLAAEVKRLRDESERRNAAADGWNEKAIEHLREAKRLEAELQRVRDEHEVTKADLRNTISLLELSNENAAKLEDQMRETIRVMSTNEGQLQMRIAQLETKLGRVAPLPVKWRRRYEESGRDSELSGFEDCADEVEAVLE